MKIADIYDDSGKKIGELSESLSDNGLGCFLTTFIIFLAVLLPFTAWVAIFRMLNSSGTSETEFFLSIAMIVLILLTVILHSVI